MQSGSYYSFIDNNSLEDNISNFDALIEYKVSDFKHFSNIATELSEFRKQARNINMKYGELTTRINNYDCDIRKMDEVYNFHQENAEWKDKVMDLKNMYLKLANYDEDKKELEALDEQKSLSELISNEFKIQLNERGTCVLCSENAISVFLDPCGHVCCSSCWSKTRQMLCPCCRTAVTTKKIFMI